MPKSKTRRHSRRYKNKRGGEKTPDLDKLERGPTPKDITPFLLPADPRRGEEANKKFVEETLRLERIPTFDVDKFYSQPPPEERERMGMEEADAESKAVAIESVVNEYDQPMPGWFKENGGRKSRRRRRKGRKSRRHRRSRRH